MHQKIYATDIRFWFLRFMKHKVQKYIKTPRIKGKKQIVNRQYEKHKI